MKHVGNSTYIHSITCWLLVACAENVCNVCLFDVFFVGHVNWRDNILCKWVLILLVLHLFYTRSNFLITLIIVTVIFMLSFCEERSDRNEI